MKYPEASHYPRNIETIISHFRCMRTGKEIDNALAQPATAVVQGVVELSPYGQLFWE